MTGWRVIRSAPAAGDWNMAVDEALVEAVAGGGPPVLRLYRWRPACLSFGRNQPARGAYAMDRIAAAGIDVVRRPTGGGTVLHDRELTYAVVVPLGRLGTLRETYLAVHRGLARALRSLGVPAHAGEDDAPPLAPSADACFVQRVRGELEVGGRKVVGSAVRRFGGVMLQHGSLLIEDDQTRIPGFQTGDHTPPRSVGLREVLGEAPSLERLSSAVVAAWQAELGCEIVSSELSCAERGAAERLRERYGAAEWTWRR